MMQTTYDKTKKLLPAEEKLSLLCSVSVLLNGLMVCITNGLYGKLGIYIIYIGSIIPIISVIVALVYIIFYVINLKKILLKKRLFIICLLMIIMTAGQLYMGKEFMKDVIGGTETISTEFFLIRNRLHLYTEYEELHLYLTDSQQEYLVAHEPVLDENKRLRISENLYIKGHENDLYIEYYPHSKIVVDISIN